MIVGGNMWNWECGIRRDLEDWETGEHRRSFFALQATQDRRGGVEGQLKKDEGPPAMHSALS